MSKKKNKKALNKIINIGVIGAGGRMGRMLIEAVRDNPQTTLSAAIERQGSSLIGADAGEVASIGRLDIKIVDDLVAVIKGIDTNFRRKAYRGFPQFSSFCSHNNHTISTLRSINRS